MNNFYKPCLVIITISMLITSCAPVTALPIPTATAYIPVSQNTPIPLVYEKIIPENAPSLTLLTRWEFSTQLETLGFLPSYDVLCGRNHETYQSWDLFTGISNSISTDCHIPLSGNRFGRAISSDGLYSVEISSGDLIVEELSKPDTYTWFYLGDAVSTGISSSGEYIIIAFQNGDIWIVPKSEWSDNSNYLNLRPELKINIGKAPQQILFSKDDSLMAFLFDDQTIQLWSVSNLSLYSTINGHLYPIPEATKQSLEDKISSKHNPDEIYKAVLSPDNRILITVYGNNYIRLWDTETGKFLVALEGCQDNAEVTSLLFSPSKRLLASLYGGYWVCIWGILPDNLDEAKLSATAMPESAFPAVSPAPFFPKPTPTPKSTLPDYQSQTPLSWPVSMPTNQQIIEARECSIETLAESRYHEEMNYWELENAHPLNSACDWAVLAVAYRSHFEDKDSIPEEGKRAFFEAVRENPAFAMSTSLFYAYFNSMELGTAPPLASQPITSVVIDYEWNGMGEPSNVQYHIEIDKANLSADQMKINAQAQPKDLTNNLAHTLDPQNIQEISKALTDFLPVQSSFILQNCTDNYPNWNIELTFLDGTEQIIKTYESNFFNAGGPWFMELNGQNYIQFSSALVNVISDLFEALGLPLGQPSAMFCSSADTFDLAFP